MEKKMPLIQEKSTDPIWRGYGATVYREDCLAALSTLADGSVDCVVTDPPAGIDFMGKKWDEDHGGREAWIDWLSTRMLKCKHVVKPCGYGLVWAIPRTSHWTATALEDAGWEIRDRISHLFGQGFPKGQGCLKPACEDWWLVRKPGKGVLPLGIDECRVPADWANDPSKRGLGYGYTREGDKTGNNVYEQGRPPRTEYDTTKGRYPANVTHDGSPEVLEAFAAFGEKKSGSGKRRPHEWQSVNAYGFSESVNGASDYEREGDTGTAARFFYCSKASKADRGEGNSHPTVKPLTLMEWLVKLVCPPGGTVLDPFAGSGSTGVACLRTGRHFIGIEKETEYATCMIKRLIREKT